MTKAVQRCRWAAVLAAVGFAGVEHCGGGISALLNRDRCELGSDRWYRPFALFAALGRDLGTERAAPSGLQEIAKHLG